MMCSFCGATKVKLHAINYGGNPLLVCVTCQELDGIKGDK